MERHPSPNATAYDELEAVTALSASDAWAVGVAYSSTNATPLTEHWNGTQWSIIPSPIQGNGSLDGTSTDVWAVGELDSSQGCWPWTLHWNGSSWSVAKGPNLSTNSLHAVAAHSATDVWAVGYASGTTLIEHWNGTRWSVVSSPNPAGYDRLSGVAVVPGSTQVWAEGIQAAPTGDYQTLTELYC